MVWIQNVPPGAGVRLEKLLRAFLTHFLKFISSPKQKTSLKTYAYKF